MKNVDYTRKADIYRNKMSEDNCNFLNEEYFADDEVYENYIFGSPSDGTSYVFLEEMRKALKRKKAKRAAIAISIVVAIIGTVIFIVSHGRKKGG